MAPNAHLTLFPSSNSTSQETTRRPSLRKLQTNKAPNANGELQLKGVAFQVVSSPKIQPATEATQHSLFCNPKPTETVATPPSASASATLTPNSAKSGPLRRNSRTRRRSSPLVGSAGFGGNAPTVEEDELSDLPQNTHFGSGSTPKRSLSLRKPDLIKTQVPAAADLASPLEEKADAISPLPTKTHFGPPPPPRREYPGSLSDFSPGYTSPMRSIFPRYDPSKTLDEQQYFPTTRAPSPPAYSSPVSTVVSPASRFELKRYDSAVGLIDHYEHIPVAGHADLQALWKASVEEFPCEGRKVQFQVFQPVGGSSMALAIGTSHQDIMYSFEKDKSLPAPREAIGSKRLSIKKHCPTAPYSAPVSQLVLPEKSDDAKDLEITAIFPHAAAVHAIEAVSNSPQAAEIATFDPTAQSLEAARLAQNAVTIAHQAYSCDLIKKTRKRDSLGTVEAAYDLKHPLLGRCAITVAKSQSAASRTGPRAKISLHHPTATPAAIAADTLNLAFLDFAHDACVLDLPGLLALDSRYVVDTVVSALLAVAVIENDALVKEQLTFAPPPKAPVGGVKSESTKKQRRASLVKSASVSSQQKKSKWYRKEKESKGIVEVAPPPPPPQQEPEQVELPGLGRAVLGLTGMAIKGAFWVLGTGVKVAVKIVKAV